MNIRPHRGVAPVVLGLLAQLACSSSPTSAPTNETPAIDGGSSGQTTDATSDSDVGAAPYGDSHVDDVVARTDSGALDSQPAPFDTTAPGDLLIDDFEDGNGKPLVGSGWFDYTDQANGGGSTFTIARGADGSMVMAGEGYKSKLALEAAFTFDQGTLTYQPYVGFGVAVGAKDAPMDLTRYVGVSYKYRGAAHRMRVQTFDVEDYDFIGVDVPESTTWTTVTIPFKLMRQVGFGAKVTFDPSNVDSLSFELRGDTGDAGTLAIDDLTVVATVAATGPDMEIRPAAPPADKELASTAIANPLQAKALKYLDRGYNITNWLEEKRFAGFTYDEKYVAALAKAGFKSIRLPVDLDLYVTERTGSGETLKLSVHDDLFTVLDSFSTWTATHGLSLTIDYHQYDKSFDITNPDSVAESVQLWSLVAEHFASNPREDLFFELLNEPELSARKRAPTQAEMTTVAEQMIAAIRKHDTKHTVIFGDVQWYGIDMLAKREPLSDNNVIYAFHTYDPMIFTHQGASWAGMGSTHDVPYPYTTERWSRYSADLGFSSSQESWVVEALQAYFRNGHRSAIRNHIVNAKRWAVDHDLPVICNEFGALDLTSRPEDRLRYYSDVVSIFEELQIPWQHWFMIMDKTGAVPVDLKTAMHLE